MSLPRQRDEGGYGVMQKERGRQHTCGRISFLLNVLRLSHGFVVRRC